MYFDPVQNVGSFNIHVTAVYNPGQVESNYLQTAYCYGFALNTNKYNKSIEEIFPNPTSGLLNINSVNLE
jgi:hypothetical protein